MLYSCNCNCSAIQQQRAYSSACIYTVVYSVRRNYTDIIQSTWGAATNGLQGKVGPSAAMRSALLTP